MKSPLSRMPRESPRTPRQNNGATPARLRCRNEHAALTPRRLPIIRISSEEIAPRPFNSCFVAGCCSPGPDIARLRLPHTRMKQNRARERPSDLGIAYISPGQPCAWFRFRERDALRSLNGDASSKGRCSNRRQNRHSTRAPLIESADRARRRQTRLASPSPGSRRGGRGQDPPPLGKLGETPTQKPKTANTRRWLAATTRKRSGKRSSQRWDTVIEQWGPETLLSYNPPTPTSTTSARRLNLWTGSERFGWKILIFLLHARYGKQNRPELLSLWPANSWWAIQDLNL